MFSLGHFSANKEMIPSGWACVDEDKNYPPLDDRVPKSKSSPQSNSEEFELESSRAHSETSNEDDTFRSDAQSNQTRMNEESSDEDELARPQPTRVSLIHFISSYLHASLCFYWLFTCFQKILWGILTQG